MTPGFQAVFIVGNTPIGRPEAEFISKNPQDLEIAAIPGSSANGFLRRVSL
jgi:hypothetical protein